MQDSACGGKPPLWCPRWTPEELHSCGPRTGGRGGGLLWPCRVRRLTGQAGTRSPPPDWCSRPSLICNYIKSGAAAAKASSAGVHGNGPARRQFPRKTHSVCQEPRQEAPPSDSCPVRDRTTSHSRAPQPLIWPLSYAEAGSGPAELLVGCSQL